MISAARVAHFIRDVWRSSRATPADLAELQRSRLAALLEFARSNSPLLRDLYAHLPESIDGLRQLPPVTKSALMTNFDDWVTDPALSLHDVRSFVADKSLIGSTYLDRYSVWTTSGTSGDPGIFIQDSESLAVYIALAAVRAMLAWNGLSGLLRFLIKGLRVAPIVTSGGHYASSSLREIALAARPSLAQSISNLTVLSPLPELVQDLNAFHPAALVGYPLAMLLLAREQREGRLQINPVFICTVGEWLAPAAREEIAGAFKCAVRDAYASSEFLGIAYQCNHARLHVNTDWVILEAVDEAYQPVPAGRPSHSALLTNLVNRTQPVIRYELGDSITIHPDVCPCGSSLPSITVEGRQDEILSFCAPDGKSIHLLPMAIATVVEETPGVHRYQIIKSAADMITLRIEPRIDAQDEQVWKLVIPRVAEYLQSQRLPHVRIERSAQRPAGDPGSGKFRLVWSESKAPR
jgi:phenylacetate-coenzyme A ligase PaaK-like adenylate-forming protein